MGAADCSDRRPDPNAIAGKLAAPEQRTRSLVIGAGPAGRRGGDRGGPERRQRPAGRREPRLDPA